VRIAVGQISLESNHFVSHACELDFFRQTGFLHEKGQLFDLRGTGGEIAGMLSTLESDGKAEVLPLIAARANSAGPLSQQCYSYLRRALLDELQRLLPVDGVLLSHHGSMAAVDKDDPEGDMAAAVRRLIGHDIPFVMTLDLHGNVTRRMVESCTAILGYEQYPHYDTFQTGSRAANLLLRAARREVSPAMSYAKLPLLLTAFHGTTRGDAPFGRLMRKAKALERESGILSTSLFFVGSYIDVPEMGSGALVVSDGDLVRSTKECRRLATEFWQARKDFAVETCTVADALRRGRSVDGGPVLLLDTADTTGGGAAGDGAGMIRALLEERVAEASLAMVVDPEAVRACADAEPGSEITFAIGHKLDPQWGSPVIATVKVARVFEGRFEYSGGILGGTSTTMGLSAVVTAGSLSILIASYATYDWADEQYRCAGLDPRSAKFVGVKNMMNFRNGYPYAKAHFVLDLPGPTPADMRMLPFRRLWRPVFPLDALDSEPEPWMSSSAG
jgi:microcystin degradation protein MlrC